MTEPPLDILHHARKVWVVMVPNSVAERWKAKCEASVQNEEVDDDDDAAGQLGVIRCENPEGKGDPPAFFLDVSGDGDQSTTQRFKLQARSGLQPTCAFSYQAPDADGPPGLNAKVEGLMEVKYSAEPIHTIAGADGGTRLDPLYCAAKAERTKVASTKTRHVEVVEDTRASRMALVGKRTEPPSRKRTAAEERAARAAAPGKRTRKAQDEVEHELFALFARQQRWTFLNLQRLTKQPANFLKEVLLEIAVLNKSGQHRDLYELKPHLAATTQPPPSD